MSDSLPRWTPRASQVPVWSSGDLWALFAWAVAIGAVVLIVAAIW